MSLEKAMRIELTAKEYTDFVEAYERCLVELHCTGVLLADNLPSVVWRECGEWQALDLSIGCASRLAEGERSSGVRFPLEKMGEFLYMVNRNRGHVKVRCEHLQPIISIFGKNTGNVLSKGTLNVWYTAHIKSQDLPLYKVMVDVERWYGGRLPELTPQELVMFAGASGRISKKDKQYDCTSLLRSILEEYTYRLSEFRSCQCIQMLNSFAHHLPIEQ